MTKKILQHLYQRQVGGIMLFFLIYTPILWGQELIPQIKNIPLGDQTVQLKIYTQPGKEIVYAHVHENETASLEAGLQMLKKYGGKLVTLSHSTDGTKNRNVTFTYQKTTYKFDPNRIYTSDYNVLSSSIQKVKGKGKVDDQIISMVKSLADRIWEALKDDHFILAIHNNKNTPAAFKIRWLFWKDIEPESFSIKSYIKSHNQSSDSNKSCAEIYVNPTINNSEFFIVTQKSDFDMLVKKKYSVVLQNDQPLDDGSMSVFASVSGKRYINSEAKMGNVEDQLKMLELLLTD